MTCSACVEKVTSALKGVEGVKEVSVSLDNGIAVVKHEGAELGRLQSAIQKAGFALGEKDDTVKIDEKSCETSKASCEKSGKSCCSGKSEKKEL